LINDPCVIDKHVYPLIFHIDLRGRFVDAGRILQIERQGKKLGRRWAETGDDLLCGEGIPAGEDEPAGKGSQGPDEGQADAPAGAGDQDRPHVL
jgi:hypothetical protein